MANQKRLYQKASDNAAIAGPKPRWEKKRVI